MVYRPTMAMSQSLDLAFTLWWKNFVLASSCLMDDSLEACLDLALSITASLKIVFLSFARTSSSAAVRFLFSWAISSLKMISCAMKKKSFGIRVNFLTPCFQLLWGRVQLVVQDIKRLMVLHWSIPCILDYIFEAWELIQKFSNLNELGVLGPDWLDNNRGQWLESDVDNAFRVWVLKVASHSTLQNLTSWVVTSHCSKWIFGSAG